MLLRTYSTHRRNYAYRNRLLDVRQRKAVSSSWLVRAICPFDSGWNLEDRIIEAPREEQKVGQTVVLVYLITRKLYHLEVHKS